MAGVIVAACSVKRLRLRPGDIVVLQTTANTMLAVATIRERVAEFFPNNKVIVLAKDHDLSVIEACS